MGLFSGSMAMALVEALTIKFSNNIRILHYTVRNI
jgi:hypothetical protein